MIIQIGDIFLTRNIDKIGNYTFGHWNHCAIIILENVILEAQNDLGGLATFKLQNFCNRYPEFIRLRHRSQSIIKGEIAANEAIKYFNSPYRTISSVFRKLRPSFKGENCVSIVRRAYSKALKKDPKWKKPDDIINDPDLYIIESKYDENWEEPNDWWAGRIN